MLLSREKVKEIFGVDYYDGTQIHKRFAYRVYRESLTALGAIFAFRAPAKVELAGMIDQEDLITSDFIYADDMIHFCAEIPNMCPLGMVAFQRLFNTQLAQILSSNYIHAPIEMKGDDLIVHSTHEQHGIIQQKGKCSVSICYVKNNVGILHTGINIVAGKKAPAYAYSTNLTDVMAADFMRVGVGLFYAMMDSLYIATSKVDI